jgi:hypothetical protein
LILPKDQLTFGLCYDFRQKLPYTQDYEHFYAECLQDAAGKAIDLLTWLKARHAPAVPKIRDD